MADVEKGDDRDELLEIRGGHKCKFFCCIYDVLVTVMFILFVFLFIFLKVHDDCKCPSSKYGVICDDHTNLRFFDNEQKVCYKNCLYKNDLLTSRSLIGEITTASSGVTKSNLSSKVERRYMCFESDYSLENKDCLYYSIQHDRFVEISQLTLKLYNDLQDQKEHVRRIIANGCVFNPIN
jgi:hypothetical protein